LILYKKQNNNYYMKYRNSLEQKRNFEFLFYKIYHFIFGEKFLKKINYNFDTSKTRLDLIHYLIKKKNYKSYLEIGCHQDEVFSLVNIDKVGVDPMSGGNFRGTSDEFFLQNKKKFDCIFIDGLHIYEQVIKDIKNSINFLSENGTIILHDCLPSKVTHQYVPRSRYTWNGDVWKAIVEARTWKDVETFTILADQGLGVITKKKNSDLLIMKNKNFKKIKFEYLYYNYEKIMRTITYDNFINLID